MTTTTPTPPTSPNFLKAFVPGLVLGLAVGLLAGAYLGGIFESRGGGDLPPARIDGTRTAQPRDRDPLPVEPPVTLPAEPTAATNPNEAPTQPPTDPNAAPKPAAPPVPTTPGPN